MERRQLWMPPPPAAAATGGSTRVHINATSRTPGNGVVSPRRLEWDKTSGRRGRQVVGSSTAAVVPWEPSVEPHGHSPWSPEIAKRFRGLNPGHPLGVSGHPHVRPEWGDIPPTYPLLHHRAAHGQRPWRNGGVVNPTGTARLPDGRPPAQGQPPTHAAPPGSTPSGSGSRWPS